jgi:hypothetical protein
VAQVNDSPEFLPPETPHLERAFALDQPEDLLGLLPLVELIFDQSPDDAVVGRRGPTAAQRRPDARPSASLDLLESVRDEGGETRVRAASFSRPRHARPDR